jgi:hypothetical protein
MTDSLMTALSYTQKLATSVHIYDQDIRTQIYKCVAFKHVLIIHPPSGFRIRVYIYKDGRIECNNPNYIVPTETLNKLLIELI